MALSGYSVENYKAFAENASIEIKPLTLFFGFNSSGKSALLRLLPLLRDSILSDNKRPLVMASEAARGASFNDVKSQFSSSPVIAIQLRWDRKKKQFPASAEFSIRDLPDFRTQVVEKLKILSWDDELFELEWIPSSTEEGKLSTQYLLKRGSRPPAEVSILFEGLTPHLHSQETVAAEALVILDALALALRRFAKGVYWLQALRSLPLRREDFTGLAGSLSPDGAEITQMLLEDESRGGRVLEDVSRWYEETTRHRLELRRGTFAGKDLFSLTLVSAAKDARGIEIVDTGEGMGQVLPVIGLLAFAKHGRLGPSPIISIEHPELHLHSSAHPGLAALFCEVAGSNRDARFIVETHSENFLLRVQLSIARGELNSKDVVIYWVRSSDDGASVIDKIEFDDLARPLGDRWPPGIFAETLDQSRALIRARQAVETK